VEVRHRIASSRVALFADLFIPTCFYQTAFSNFALVICSYKGMANDR